MKQKKIIAHIERTKGKGFAVYAEAHGSVIASDGASVEEAKASFEEAVRASIEALESLGKGKSAQALRASVIEYVYDLSALFALFKDVNVSQFARRTDISNEQLRQWRAGAKAPTQRLKEIEEALHALGNELLAVRLT